MASILHRNILLAFLLLFFKISPVSASAGPATLELVRRNTTVDNSEPLNCTTPFSSDYYGFGVRLGVYFAWLSSYFANTMLPEEISGGLDTNSIFLVALLISLFRSTLVHELFQIDGLIVMHLSSGFLFSSLSVWGYRTLHYQQQGPAGIKNFGGYGTHLRLVLVAAISIYGTWFWWEGVDDGLIAAQDERCKQIYTWFFKKWPVDDGVNIYYIIVTVGCSLYYCSMCFVAVLTAILRLFRGRWSKKVDFETGFNSHELKVLYNIFRIFNIVWIVFCASMIEMTLTDNNMLNTLAQNGNIAFPAQLLPMLVGVLSFARVLWLIFKDWRRDISKTKEVDKSLSIHFNSFSFSWKKILFPLSHAGTSDTTVINEYSSPNVASHPLYQRYLVAWLPWLSELGFWKRSRTDIEAIPPVESSSSYKDDRKDNVNAEDEQLSLSL